MSPRPAMPDTEPTRDDGQPAPVLTDDEREALADAFVAANRAEFLDWYVDGIDNPDDPDLPILHAVERLVAAAVDRARREGRTEVKAAVEEWFTNVSLDDLYAVNGWERPSSSASARGGDDGG